MIQACADLPERRRTVAVLRACGAGTGPSSRLLAGGADLVVPAAAFGIVLERLVLGPALAHLAAGYATLALECRLSADATSWPAAALPAGSPSLGGPAGTRETVVGGWRGMTRRLTRSRAVAHAGYPGAVVLAGCGAVRLAGAGRRRLDAAQHMG